MSLAVDLQYLDLISSHLVQFKAKSSRVWNCRCPVCGDSAKNKTKARGYFYIRNGELRYYCQNESRGWGFRTILKRLDPVLYDRYRLESWREEHGIDRKSSIIVPVESPAKRFKESIRLKTIESLDDGHPAKQYIVGRKIPAEFHSKLYYAPDFAEFVKRMLPDYEAELKPNEPRIVIPFYDRYNKLIAFQGRALGDKGLRYITVKIKEDAPKIFGLERVDLSKPVYVFEGPFDSLFLPNSLASAGSDLPTNITNCVMVFDREPRNKAIVSKIESAINKGLPVCLLPSTIKAKDVNQMIESGYTTKQVKDLIDQHTYSGLKATLALADWRKDKHVR